MSSYGDRVDMYSTTAGFVRRIKMVAEGRNSLGASHCLSEIETISELVQGKYVWGPKQKDYNDCGRHDYSKYIMHTLLFALRPMDEKKLFSQMPADKQDMLKQAILASQLCPKPRLGEARKEKEDCISKARHGKFNSKTNEKDLLPCMRNMAECAEFVADENIWVLVQEEMHKWSELLGVPYDDSMIQEDIVPIKRKKEQVVNPDEPPQQNIVISGASVTKSEFVGEQVMSVEVAADPKQVRGRGRPKGSKNRTPRQKKVEPVVESPIPGQNLKKILNKNGTSDIFIDANGRTWWSNAKLARELGWDDVARFNVRRSRWKNDEATEAEKKFMSDERYVYKKGNNLFFNSDYVDSMWRPFFGEPGKSRAKKNVVTSVNDKQKTPVVTPQVSPTEQEIVVPGAEQRTEPVTAVQAVVIKPTDPKAIGAYLNKLQELCVAAGTEQTEQQTLAEDFSSKAQTAKTKAEEAHQMAEDLQGGMTQLKQIQSDLQQAEDALRVAEEHYNAEQAKLDQWFGQYGHYLGK